MYWLALVCVFLYFHFRFWYHHRIHAAVAMVENFMMSENFVFTREMENVFKENTFKFNQPIDNWWTSLHKIHKKHSLTHTRTCTWRKSGIESGTPQHCGIRIILSRLLLLYRILSPSLNLSGTKCQLFGIFLFLRSFFSFRVFFSFPPLWVQTFSFFFFTNGIARGLFIF